MSIELQVEIITRESPSCLLLSWTNALAEIAVATLHLRLWWLLLLSDFRRIQFQTVHSARRYHIRCVNSRYVRGRLVRYHLEQSDWRVALFANGARLWYQLTANLWFRSYDPAVVLRRSVSIELLLHGHDCKALGLCRRCMYQGVGETVEKPGIERGHSVRLRESRQTTETL